MKPATPGGFDFKPNEAYCELDRFLFGSPRRTLHLALLSSLVLYLVLLLTP